MQRSAVALSLNHRIRLLLLLAHPNARRLHESIPTRTVLTAPVRWPSMRRTEAAMDDPKQILVEREGHAARVTINRPSRRNALSFAAWQSLAAAFDNLAADPEVRVVVLTGAGERAFCAGNDISEFAEKRSTPEQIEAYDAVLSHAYQIIRDFEKPIVARVRGFAVGGGFELMQLCDLQIASAGARFAMTPARLGLGYRLDDVQLLVDRIGPRAAREMLFTGRLFDADEAERLGFVTRVVPDEDLDATVDACVAEITASAPLSVRAIKVAIGESLKPPADRDHARCDALAAACNRSEDYREGQNAFAERRPPEFRGR